MAVHTNNTLRGAASWSGRGRVVWCRTAQARRSLREREVRRPAVLLRPNPACVSNHNRHSRHAEPDISRSTDARDDWTIGICQTHGSANTRLFLALMGQELACDVSGWRRVEERGRSAHPGAGVARPPRGAHHARLARQPHGALQQASSSARASPRQANRGV